MKRLSLLAVACILFCSTAMAWGKEGHEIVAQFAFSLLSDKCKTNIQQVLGDMSVPHAGTWMDDVRNDHTYDFLKPKHYINIDKNAAYAPTTDENIVNELLRAIRELQHKDKLCAQQAQFDVLVLFHLIGDIHQPLHTGYGVDKGGNDIQLTFNGQKTNLHSLWDSKLIENQKITLGVVEDAYKQLAADEISRARKTGVEDWLKTSRMYLPAVYNFSDPALTEAYAKENRELLISQLMYAGIRLAATLEKLFGEPAPEVSTTSKTDQGPVVEITPDMASQYIGKQVRVCGKVFGVKEMEKVNFINMGAPYPNSPFTVVVFAGDKNKLNVKLPKLNNKNICVTGTVKEYNGKAEIIVNEASQLEIK